MGMEVKAVSRGIGGDAGYGVPKYLGEEEIGEFPALVLQKMGEVWAQSDSEKRSLSDPSFVAKEVLEKAVAMVSELKKDLYQGKFNTAAVNDFHWAAGEFRGGDEFRGVGFGVGELMKHFRSEIMAGFIDSIMQQDSGVSIEVQEVVKRAEREWDQCRGKEGRKRLLELAERWGEMEIGYDAGREIEGYGDGSEGCFAGDRGRRWVRSAKVFGGGGNWGISCASSAKDGGGVGAVGFGEEEPLRPEFRSKRSPRKSGCYGV
jgi:hypothetical protein